MRSRDRRPTVLGLCSFTHDSAGALITGGKLTGMAEEERLSGVKHTREYPAEAVQWLLADAGLTSADVDVVAYNFAGHRYLAGITGIPGHLLQGHDPAPGTAASGQLRRHPPQVPAAHETLKGMFPNGQVRGVPHHLAHGTYAFAASGFDQAAVLIIDSLGETCTTSISSARTRPDGDVRYRIIETISDPASLGYAYGAVTAHLGWRRGDEEGTVMALAALGDPAGSVPCSPARSRSRPPGSRWTLPCSRCGCSGTAGRVSPRPSSLPPARLASPARRPPRSTPISRRDCRSAPSR